MADRGEMLEAALEVYPEGLALLDEEGRVVFWNRAAESATGYNRANVVARQLPQALAALVSGPNIEDTTERRYGTHPGCGVLVHAQHAGGSDVPLMTRNVVLRDGLGVRIGAAAAFHIAANTAALPHGETADGSEVRESEAGMRDRLEAAWEAHYQDGAPFGVLWVAVDQADDLRRTHGARACEAMLENVERTLANALRSGGEIGRWGDSEFIVVSQEGRGEVLANHGRVLAGIARTTDFRWWGDRIPLTVSMGAAEAAGAETLAELLEGAQAAMQSSMRCGGNHVSLAPGRAGCSRS